MQNGNLLDELPKENVTGDTNSIKIKIIEHNHVQDEGEEKDQSYKINIFPVVHDKEVFFNDEKLIGI